MVRNSNGCAPLGQTNLVAAAPKNYGRAKAVAAIGKHKLKTIGFLVGVKNILVLKESSGGEILCVLKLLF